MEGRMRRYGGQPCPERSKPAAEPPQTLRLGMKIPVVYYLSRNHQLDHPHFIEVPISSPDGLYLRDFIERLNVLRGRKMPAMYSWSYKRSYKNGFVWHDLSEDDLIHPAHSSEYVLKGSELLDRSPPDGILHGNHNPPKLHSSQHPQAEPLAASPNQEASSSSSSPHAVTKEAKSSSPPPPPPLPQDEELSPRPHGTGSSGNISPEPIGRRHHIWETGSPNTAEYSVCLASGAVDASTQTEDGGERSFHRRDARTRGSSNNESLDLELDGGCQNRVPRSKPGSEISRDEISPPGFSPSTSSSFGKTETLESLIRVDMRKMNYIGILEEEEVFVPKKVKLKAANMIMQLITCGAIFVKDHQSFGLVPTYKPKFSHFKFPPQVLANSVTLGELDCATENSRLMELSLKDKAYFSGSLLETKKNKEQGAKLEATIKHSSSDDLYRSCKSQNLKKEDRTVDTAHFNCLPRTIKMSANKQSRTETMLSPASDGARKSSAGPECSPSTSRGSSKGGSKRITDSSSAKGSSMRLESFKEENEKLIKIEERLTSGARIIIQSSAMRDDSGS